MATFPNPLTTQYLDAAIQARPTSQAIRQSYIGLSLMPMKAVPDYELTWDIIRQQNHLSGIYAMTGAPIPGDGPDYEQLIADVVNIMGSRELDEQTVMTLREPGELSLQSRVLNAARSKARRKLREMLGQCDDEVDATIEYLIMHALQGSIVWPPRDASGSVIASIPAYWGDAVFTLSMGLRAALVQDISALSGHSARPGGGQNWKHASADPVLDLEVIAENTTELTGLNMEGAMLIMSRSVLSWMATRPNVLLWFRGAHEGQKFINTAALKEFLESQLGYVVKLYDSKWTYSVPTASPSGPVESSIRFLKEGRMLVIPKAALGSDTAYFASPPTSGPEDAYNPGKYTWALKEKRPPWSWDLGVGIKGFPILKTSQEIGVYDVYA